MKLDIRYRLFFRLMAWLARRADGHNIYYRLYMRLHGWYWRHIENR